MQKPAVTVMIKAARQAGNLIIRQIGRVEGLNVVEKAKHDFASEVDAQAEREIIRELKRAFPGHAFLGEEGGKQGSGRFTWVIDPLDGTSNYLHGIGHYCVSIALLDHDEPVHGVVYDPLRNEIFYASKGSGAYLNERRIRVSQRNELNGAMLITGFPPRERKRLSAQLRTVEHLLISAEAEDIRRTGSAALDLAYVAAGRADGYFEAGVKPWDIAAGMLLVREAGGRCCDFRGNGEHLMDRGQLIASNIKLSEPLSRAMVDTGYAASFD